MRKQDIAIIDVLEKAVKDLPGTTATAVVTMKFNYNGSRIDSIEMTELETPKGGDMTEKA